MHSDLQRHIPRFLEGGALNPNLCMVPIEGRRGGREQPQFPLLPLLKSSTYTSSKACSRRVLRRENTHRLYENASCVVAGLTADANLLVNHARLSAQRYLYQYGENMPVEQLVKQVCNYKQVRKEKGTGGSVGREQHGGRVCREEFFPTFERDVRYWFS